MQAFLYSSELQSEDKDTDITVLPKNAVVNNDYFAYGRNIEISGTVNGDVYIFGGQVFIDGIVNGDVIAVAGSIEISGIVKKDIRILAGQASISGKIGRNITAITASMELSPSATVENNALIIAGNVDLESVLKKNLRLYASSVRISNKVYGNIKAYVGYMRLTSKANIQGEIEYWSNKEASIDSNAQIKHTVIHHPSFFYKFFHAKFSKILKIGSKVAGLLMNFFYTLIVGLIMIRYFKFRISRTVDLLNQKPLQSFLAGIVLVLLLPITFILFIISILGVPFALALLSLTVLTFYTAKILTILWATKWVFPKNHFQKSIRLCFLVGLIIYFSLTTIPYFGNIISVAALTLGLGGGVMSKLEKEKY